jgi:hypothetical protein
MTSRVQGHMTAEFSILKGSFDWVCVCLFVCQKYEWFVLPQRIHLDIFSENIKMAFNKKKLWRVYREEADQPAVKSQLYEDIYIAV